MNANPDQGFLSDTEHDSGADSDYDDAAYEHEPNQGAQPNIVQQFAMQQDPENAISAAELNAVFANDTRETWAKDANELLGKRMFCDWAAEGRELRADDRLTLDFRLDYFAVVSKPRTPIQVARGPLFETISLNLSFWMKRYRASTPSSLPFPIERRTFYLGESNRLQWFIVMKPLHQYVWPRRAVDKQKEIRYAMAHCSMTKDNAGRMLSFIASIFQSTPELSKTGIDQRYVNSSANWKDLGADRKVDISRDQWLLFQQLFSQSYEEYFSTLDEEHFYRCHEPTFHTYDYGQDLALGNGPEQVIRLERQLSREFAMDGVEMIGAALAVNVSIEAANGEHMSALVDFRRCAAEFPRTSARTFFPLGFSPRVGSVQSLEPPTIMLTSFLSATIEQTKQENGGAEVLRSGPFQVYSVLKQSIRPTASDLLVRRGYYTASRSVDRTMLAGVRQQSRHQKLGAYTNPANLNDDSVPIRREASRIATAQSNSNDNIRFEFNMAFFVGNAAADHANFHYFIDRAFRPISTAMADPQMALVSKFVCVFMPRVFPGVLVSFLRMLYAVEAGLANVDFSPFKSEAVSCIERLALLCVTGDARSIPTKLWNALGTTDALTLRGWPYVKPSLINFKAARLGCQSWPMENNDLVLHSKAGICFNYDIATYLRLKNYMVLQHFGSRIFNSISVVQGWIRRAIRVMESELREWVTDGLLHAAGHREGTEDANVVREFMAHAHSLAAPELYMAAVRTVSQHITVTGWDLNEFSGHLYDMLTAPTSSPSRPKLPIIARHIWHANLRVALICPPGTLFREEGPEFRKRTLVSILVAEIQSSGMVCFPGHHPQTHVPTLSQVIELFSKARAKAKRQAIRNVEGSLSVLGLDPTVSEIPAWLIDGINEWQQYVNPDANKQIPKRIRPYLSTFQIILDIAATINLEQEPFLKLVVIYTSIYHAMRAPPRFNLATGTVEEHQRPGGVAMSRWVAAFFLKALTVKVVQSSNVEDSPDYAQAVNEVLSRCRIPWASLAMVGLTRSLPGCANSTKCREFHVPLPDELESRLRECLTYVNGKDRSMFQLAIRGNNALANRVYQQAERDS
ncbi:hypothetical protein V1521DRAFT_470884 [Lipomyces starkeyi]